MKVTVATVCFNSEDTIEKTIESVLEQTFEPIEYIIIDGHSSDSTVDKIEKYKKEHDIVLVSEQDKGLYDAMNKAAKLATGDYILYMNSGDVFADSDSVKKMAAYLDGGNEIVYGNVIRCKLAGEELERYHGKKIELRLLLQGKMMCHQSVFVRTDIMREYGFDLDYSITADYDFIARTLHDGRKFRYVNDITVSKVDSIEGISSRVINMDAMREQDDRSLKQNFPIWYMIVTPPKAVIRYFRRIAEKRKI